MSNNYFRIKVVLELLIPSMTSFSLSANLSFAAIIIDGPHMYSFVCVYLCELEVDFGDEHTNQFGKVRNCFGMGVSQEPKIACGWHNVPSIL